LIGDADTLRQKLDYMHQNPVRKGHCARAEDWEFSSASWYADGSGPLRIDEFDW
jgi:putative transposase